jgi:hypothetical protein
MQTVLHTKTKKQLELNLKGLNRKLEALEAKRDALEREREQLMCHIYRLKGRCYRCEEHGGKGPGRCYGVFADCLVPQGLVSKSL